MAEWLRDDLQADWNACRRVAHLPVPDQCSSLLMEAAREQLWAPRKEGFMRVQHLTLLNCAQRDHDKDRSLVLCSTSLGVRCSCSLYLLHFGLKYVTIVSSPEQFLRE
ncbi:hypothetical protein V3C99_005868 [Haemonchus contortus]